MIPADWITTYDPHEFSKMFSEGCLARWRFTPPWWDWSIHTCIWIPFGRRWIKMIGPDGQRCHGFMKVSDFAPPRSLFSDDPDWSSLLETP